MDKIQAQNLVKETFENPFDESKFILFIKNLLNTIEEKTFTYRGNLIPDAYEQYISTLERIGKYTDGENEIDILVCKLKKETSLERARTMQRNFIAWYLNGSRGGIQKDAALVAFVSPDEDDWRFSLVKMDYKMEEKESGRVKVKEEFTPARRWSFLVGKNEKSHTAQSQFVPILLDDEHNPTLSRLEEAFNIETVTKEFFEKYRELFWQTQEELDKVLKNNPNIQTDFETKGVNTDDFAKKLLGQIVFLYFLQKKGWFGVRRDADWGTGPKNFLRELFDKKHGNYLNFFNDVLEPLFYDALARDRSDIDHWNDQFKCKIPFLNGGLFDPINNYDWVKTDIFLSDELFSNTCKTKEGDTGNGILDIFDRYNFTVREDEPLEKEVAVDPEMLGKVFENLLEVKNRKSKGTYYTPREIVHYMCQQSLINYLATEISSAIPSPSSVIPSEARNLQKDIEILIKYGEQVGENEVRIEAKGKETDTYYHKIPESIRQNAKLIDEKLANIKVCDPAAGSGAFLVGMMTEIIKARNVLTTFLSLRGAEATKQSRSVYNYKRECIEKSLYGVDIDPGAVEIAKLRLWLSLVVDEEDIKQIKPLPNLDYKIMQGNSLLEEYEGIKLIDDRFFKKEESEKEIIERLCEKRDNFSKELFESRDKGQLTPLKKVQLADGIKKIEKQIKNFWKEKRAESTEKNSRLLLVSETTRKAEQFLKLQKQFFAASQKSDKGELKEKIENLSWELIDATLKEQGKQDKIDEINRFRKSNVKSFFLWKLHFAEIFQEKGGFDVVIANPPYVEHKKLKTVSGQLKQLYKTYSGTADLYVYFYERALNILKNQGVLTFISSNKFIKTSYGKNLRDLLSSHAISQIIDFTKVHVFNALVASCVLIISKNNSAKEVNVTDIDDTIFDAFSLSEYIQKRHRKIASINFGKEIWQLDDDRKLKIKSKIELNSDKISDIAGAYIYRGVTTGYNPAFIIDANIKRELIKSEESSKEIIKPLLQGRNIKRWVYEMSKEYLLFVPWHFPLHNDLSIIGASGKAEAKFKKQFPCIYQYLSGFKEQLQNRNIDETGKRYEWYALQRCAASYYPEFEKEKIIWGLTADKWAFAYDNKRHYLPSNGYILTSEGEFVIKYLLALLNSVLLRFYFGFIGIMTAGGAYTLKHETIGEFPIKRIGLNEQQQFISLVDRILAIAGDEDYLSCQSKQTKVKKYERQIDQMVYNLYDLTTEEIEIVENFNNREQQKRT